MEDQLSINNPAGLRLQFYLFNNLHVIVLRNEIALFENNVIACPVLSPGFYIAKIISGNGMQTTKLVKI